MKKNIMPTIVLGTICVVVALLLSVINMVTGPIIEAQKNAAANEALLVVMPDGENFEELDVTTLALSENVTNVYKETTGKGYVFCVVSSGYKPGMTVMVGVDAEGKITGTTCIATSDTFGKEPEISDKYNGQTLSDFAPYIITGATLTSNGYRDAVNAALQANVLVSGGKLDDSILLEGLIPELAPGYVATEKVDNVSGNITKAYKAKTDAGFAYIMKDGDASFLVLVNATGGAKVYDVESNDVTADHAALVTEATAHASANQKSYKTEVETKLGRMFDGATDMTELKVDTFGTIAYAASFKVEGVTYYGFYSRSIGFHQMDVYVVLDENGAIAKIDAKQFIFDEEYFMNFGGMNVSEYKNGFVGLTVDTFTGEEAIIATATMTSNAMKQSTEDAFAAFASINK